VGLTGLIFGGIAAAWLVYLVPYFLHRRGLEGEELDAAFSSTTITIVRSGVDLASADAGTDEPEATTQATQLAELTRIDRRAAARRRNVLIFLLGVELVVSVLTACGVGVWWAALIPVGLILAFLIVARVTVRRMRAGLAERARQIREADEVEDTSALRLTEADVAEHEHSIELSVPVPKLDSLLEPIPITRPTYVSTPLAPRTVRTIDLSAPVATAGIPVNLDDPVRDRMRKRNAG
jgi:hypothetical protein